MVPPVTLSSVFFSTGILSPVTMASSTAPLPFTMTPSTGTVSPAFTTTISPATTSETNTSLSTPSLKITALSGSRFTSLLIASVVFFLLLASRYLPRVMRVSMVPAVSK